MATGNSNSRKDIAWKYAYLANQNNKSDLTCNFCGKVQKEGLIDLSNTWLEVIELLLAVKSALNM